MASPPPVAAAADADGRRLPPLRRASDVRVQDGHLVWAAAAAGGRGRVALDQVLLTLDLGDAQRPGFVVVCLRERGGDDGGEDGGNGDENDGNGDGDDGLELLALQADAAPEQLLRGGRLAAMPPHLRCDDANDVAVVVSTGSGVGRAAAIWERVLLPVWRLADEALGRPSPREPRVTVTRDAQSVRRFARAALWPPVPTQQAARRATTVVLLSGDGGVADLLNGGAAEAADGPAPPVTVGLVPLGTANALFHSLHAPVATGPSPLVLAVRTLFLGAAADLPVFRATFSPGARLASPDPDAEDGAVATLYGAVVASYAFHATLVHESDTPAYRVHGDRRFGMVAQQLLGESHPYRATLTVRRPASPSPPPATPASAQTYNYVLATMVSHLERTFAISPTSRPLDNKLRLVRLGAVGGARTMDVMAKVYEGGRHVGMAWDDGHSVRYDEVEALEIQAHDDDARWRKFCVDGVIVQVPPGGSMAVSRAHRPMLRVLVDSRVEQAASASRVERPGC